MEFTRAKRPQLGIDMAPLIDVVFQLLIFFMLSSSFLRPALEVNLPKASTEDKQQQENVVISIDSSQRIFVNAKLSSLSSLRQDLASALASGRDEAVHLHGDQNIPYGLFVQIMDEARQAGARQIYLAHEAA